MFEQLCGPVKIWPESLEWMAEAH